MSIVSVKCIRWLLVFRLLSPIQGKNLNNMTQTRPPCLPGFYCPLEASTPIPCPVGSYGPNSEAVSINNCLACPPHHYCPRAALALPLPCGPGAQQPHSGQDTCLCLGEGQNFQASDAQCHCTLGYQPSNNKEVCVLKLYDICHDGKTRTQYGDCLDKYQWAVHCMYQVCQSADDFRGYDSELGLCLCKEPGERTSCGGLCRRRGTDELKLVCQSNGELKLIWRRENQVSSISGKVLETLFLHWDPLGTLHCNQQLNPSHPVYIVQTTEDGFIGLLRGHPEELNRVFFTSTQQDNEHYLENIQGEGSQTGNISFGDRDTNFTSSRANSSDIKELHERKTGVLSPITCLHLGDIILFTVSTNHYPEYDIDNLYNTYDLFDWGVFRQLKEELTLSWTPPNLFAVTFNHPGVYVFKLSSHKYRHMYVRVMPLDGQCYEPGTFFSTIPRHINRVGINPRRNLFLRPDWFVTGGLVFGAVIILCLCVALLILFREYGWPKKKSIKVQYRLLQLAYNMDDYSSKGSRVISLKKIHRNQQARMTVDSVSPEQEEFWDYEHQLDLEAFSSNTFYSLLLKQSLSVTSRLGQLTTEVKELYQGVTGKLQLLQPCLITEDRIGDGYEKIKREVEREVGRRKSFGTQLRTLLNNQLQVLKREQQAQCRVQNMFSTHLRECIRLLSKMFCNQQPFCEQKLTSLEDRMGDLVSAECQRQGAWGFLGEGTGAKLLCPETGTILTKDHIFAPDGSLRASQSLRYDSVTGLIRPNANSHMLLSSGHTMAVPPNFFVHPQTGRVMPIAGNVAYDPASSTLVFTTDSCSGDIIKWDSPLLPFVPYPTYYHSGQPLSRIHLRGLRPGQRLQLGVPMADPDTGVPVPILGVTIHPDTGLVYPLGGLHLCPLTRQRQPIQIGSPMLESRTGNLALIVGVSLDSVTGAVLPVGGVLLSDLFMDPLSGRILRVGGASVRAGQLVPYGGGYQTLLDSKALAEMFKVLELLRQLTDEWVSDTTPQHIQSYGESERRSGQLDSLLAAAKELHQAWGRSLHCQLQLQTRLDMVLDWAIGLEQDGGAYGEMPLKGSDVFVPALVGMEYPDPGGSGLSVPVLGFQTEPLSGNVLPLAGTMEDTDGKGLAPICYGRQTVDPVTGILAPVVGARLDVSRKIVVPLTASYWLTMAEQTDSVQVDVLQKELCSRNTYWQQQKLKEEDILSDLDSSLSQCVFRVTDRHSYQVQWSVRPLKEAALEMQELAQVEAQRRDSHSSHIGLILPPHVQHILTLGDEKEWHQQCAWNSELLSGLEKLEVCIEQLQQEQERYTAHEEEWTTSHLSLDRELRLREVWEQCCAKQAELDAAVNALHVARLLSQLCADTAQMVLNGKFWYKDYGLVQCSGQKAVINVVGLLREKALPLLERLNQLLEHKQNAGLHLNPCNQKISDLTKHAYGMEVSSRVWTESVPVVQGTSTQSLREPAKTQSQDTGLEMSSAPTHNSQRHTTSSGLQSQESQTLKDPAQPPNVSIPLISEEEWSKLLVQSPLFHMLKGVEVQMKTWANGTGLVRGDHNERGQSFVDILDAQWECEGELIPLCISTFNPREYLVYQHGCFLMQMLYNLHLTPVVSLQIATSLPCNNYVNNAFRNSFFYQEAEEMLFVRQQRLQSVGGFSLLLLHCLCHIRLKDMTSDSSPAFQRLFYKVLQASLAEFFQARLCAHPLVLDKEALLGDINGALWGSHAAPLLNRFHCPSSGLLSEDEVKVLHGKHCETTTFTHLQQFLKDPASHTTQ